MSETNPPNPPDSLEAVRERMNNLELPEVPRRYDKWTVFFICFHSFFCLLCLLWPYSDGQPNWIGFGVNFLFVVSNIIKLYFRRKTSMHIEQLVNHAKALRRIINTPIYTHDEENKLITINFVYILTPQQLDDLKRKNKYARSQQPRRF